MDISYQADGRMKFTPSVLEGMPVGVIIIFLAPEDAPFHLYETKFNRFEDACASYTRIYGLTTNGGTPQIYIMTSSSKPTAHFACRKVETSCICDGESLFFINPTSDMIQTRVYPQTVNLGRLSETTWPLPSTTALIKSGKPISAASPSFASPDISPDTSALLYSATVPPVTNPGSLPTNCG